MTRSRATLVALLAFALSASGCIAGMRRIGAEGARTFRATIIDSCDGTWCRGHVGSVGNRAGVALGVTAGPGFANEPGDNAPVGFAGSALMQFIMMTRVPRFALGGGVGFDSYVSVVNNVPSVAGRESNSIYAAFFDVRAALGLSDRFSIHLGLGPSYGTYRLANDGDALDRIPWGWGMHGAFGFDWMFRNRRERAAWGIRIDSNTTMLGPGDVLGSKFRPVATMLGAQLIWLTGN